MGKKVAESLAGAVQAKFQLYISHCKLREPIFIGRKEVGMAAEELNSLLNTLREVPVEIVSARDAWVDAAADLKLRYRLSYADAFAVALGIELTAPLTKGDKEPRSLDDAGLVRLHWVGA